MSHDPAQPIAPLANAEFALNRVPVTDVLMLLKLGSPGLLCIFGRPSQRRPGELDPAFFAPCKRFSVPVDFVGQHAFGVATIGGSVRFDGSEEVCRFVERIEGQPHNPGIAIHHAQMQLWPELRVRVSLPAHDRPDPWLRDAHDSVRDGMVVVLIHVQLLFVEQGQRIQQCTALLPETNLTGQNESDNEPDVPADVLQLFSYSVTDRLRRPLLALGQTKVIFPGTLPPHSGTGKAVLFTYRVDDLFQLLPAIVQQLNILRKGDVCRTAGRVQQ